MNVPAGVASDDPILQLPKVSLHDHLDGGLRPSTMIELADSTRAGVFKPVYDDKQPSSTLMLLMPMMINA